MDKVWTKYGQSTDELRTNNGGITDYELWNNTYYFTILYDEKHDPTADVGTKT